MNGIKERWAWIKTHWVIISVLSIALYVLPFLQTPWEVHGYPGMLDFLNQPAMEEPCTPGTFQIYVVVLYDNGSWSIDEVPRSICESTPWSNQWPMS